MQLIDLIPDAEVVLALEPDELGMRMLPFLSEWPWQRLFDSESILAHAVSHYPPYCHSDLIDALSEAWAWLEGTALLIPDRRRSGTIRSGTIQKLSRRAQRLAKEPDPRRALSARKIPKDALHASIREDVWALYHRGIWDAAVRSDEGG